MRYRKRGGGKRGGGVGWLGVGFRIGIEIEEEEGGGCASNKKRENLVDLKLNLYQLR